MQAFRLLHLSLQTKTSMLECLKYIVHYVEHQLHLGKETLQKDSIFTKDLRLARYSAEK